MKSAYELAMERLKADDTTPVQKLTEEQKKQLADIEAKYKAKVAEREIFLQQKLREVRTSQDFKAVAEIEKQLLSERARLEEEKEEAKERVRKG